MQKIKKPQPEQKTEEKELTPQQQKILAIRDTLSVMIATEPILTDKLFEAIETGKFFITITVMKKYKPQDKNDLHHTFTLKGIEPKDCLLSLQTIRNDLIAKKMPHAAMDPRDGWH